MNAVATFLLTLKPVFTARALRAVWYLYVISTVIDLSPLVWANPGLQSTMQWVFLIMTVLRAIATLVIVRLLLEVAIKLLHILGDAEEEADQR